MKQANDECQQQSGTSKKMAVVGSIVAIVVVVAAIKASPMLEKMIPAPKSTTAEQIIRIDGQGEVTVNPDSLRTRISVTVRETSLETVRTLAANRTRAVVDALGSLGIAGLKVRTVEITIEPITEVRTEPSTVPPSILGYEARSTLSITLTNVSMNELRNRGAQMLETVLNAGANVIGSMTFFLNEPEKARRSALEAAVVDVQKNGQAMANKAGVKIVGLKMLSGEDTPIYGKSLTRSTMVSIAESEAPVVIGFPVEPGEIVVSAQVQADFTFKQ